MRLFRSLLSKARAARSNLSRQIAKASHRVSWQLDSFVRFFGGAIYHDFDVHQNEDYKPDPYLYLWCLFTTVVFNYATCIRFVIGWFCTTPASERAIHDMTTVIGGPKEFHLICLTIWSIHNVTISVAWYKILSKGDTRVLEPLMALKKPSLARK